MHFAANVKFNAHTHTHAHTKQWKFQNVATFTIYCCYYISTHNKLPKIMFANTKINESNFYQSHSAHLFWAHFQLTQSTCLPLDGRSCVCRACVHWQMMRLKFDSLTSCLAADNAFRFIHISVLIQANSMSIFVLAKIIFGQHTYRYDAGMVLK